MSAPKNPPAFPVVPGFDESLAARFVARVDGGDWSMDRCWNWTGHLTDRGYGVFARSCVNPHHLSEGTHAENMAQMAERRRAARGPRHPKAKLTHSKAVAINVLHRGGDFSTRELATLFAMHQSTIAAIIKGDLWPDAYAAAQEINHAS